MQGAGDTGMNQSPGPSHPWNVFSEEAAGKKEHTTWPVGQAPSSGHIEHTLRFMLLWLQILRILIFKYHSNQEKYRMDFI